MWLVVVVVVGVVIVVRAYNLVPNISNADSDQNRSKREQGIGFLPALDTISEEAAVNQFTDGLPERTYDPADPNELPWRILWLLIEVNNGGMDQYFHNSSGEFAGETVADLQLIGAPKTAELIERGCKLFPEGKPAKDTELRRKQMAEFSREQLSVLQELSDPFYARNEDLNALLRAYWKEQHRKERQPVLMIEKD